MTFENVPSVLFVCVSNRGKSVMAEGLAHTVAGADLVVSSAGTEAKIGADPNQESVQTLAEVGVDIAAHKPRQLTDDMMRAADLVVVVGASARVDVPAGVATETWETDEPSSRGIEGLERMRLIRDDIARRVEDLADRMAGS